MISTDIPRILPQNEIRVQGYSQLQAQQAFNLFGAKFSQLADATEFKALKDQLIEIDISDELAILSQSQYDSMLEISVPVFGVVDLFNSGVFSSAQSFASVIKLEGFAQKADFVLVTDIVRNTYEILVGPHGEIALPKEGTGLFSIPSKITFMYNYNKNDVSSKLYLLPPPEMSSNFECHICVSHINEKMQRRVDSIRAIKVRYSAMSHINKPLLLAFTEAAYSKTDMIRDYFLSNHFHLSQQGGFNQFLLLEEAFDVLYDKILYDLIHQRLSKSFTAENDFNHHVPPLANLYQPYSGLERSVKEITSCKLKRK